MKYLYRKIDDNLLRWKNTEHRKAKYDPIFDGKKEYPYSIRCSMEIFGTYQKIRVYTIYTISQVVN